MARFPRALHEKLGTVGIVSSIVLLGIVLVAIVGPFFAKDPFALSMEKYEPPSWRYPGGTDNLGRDLLSRMITGARTALYVGLSSASISLVLGVVIGALAGFCGGWIDELLSRIIEVFLVMPIFFLLVLIVALFGANIVLTSIAIAAVTWPRNARIMRVQALSLRETSFCEAAVVSGASTFRILFYHLIPNGIAPVIANSALLIGSAVLMEAGLSFLGLGDPNIVSWGGLIRNGRESLTFAPWLSLLPGLALVTFTASVNFIGDQVSHLLNPRLSRRE